MKLHVISNLLHILQVATAPTVYGIETDKIFQEKQLIYPVATAPTVYGIETRFRHGVALFKQIVATAPTVYGIETLSVGQPYNSQKS